MPQGPRLHWVTVVNFAFAYSLDLAAHFVASVSTERRGHVLKVCNAHPAQDGLRVFRGDSELSASPLLYQQCEDWADARLAAGERLSFQLGGASAGSLVLDEIPHESAVVAVAVRRKIADGDPFESLVFQESGGHPQVAVMDAYNGNEDASVWIADDSDKAAGRHEELHFFDVVKVQPGAYDIILYGAGRVIHTSSLVALQGHSYIVVRCGSDGTRGSFLQAAGYAQETFVYPKSNPAMLLPVAAAGATGAASPAAEPASPAAEPSQKAAAPGAEHAEAIFYIFLVGLLLILILLCLYLLLKEEDPEEFDIEVLKTEGATYGIDMDEHKEGWLVDSIDGTGLINMWNLDNPEREVEVGDIIVAVNGVHGCKNIDLEMDKNMLVQLRIRKGQSPPDAKQDVRKEEPRPDVRKEPLGASQDSAAEIELEFDVSDGRKLGVSFVAEASGLKVDRVMTGDKAGAAAGVLLEGDILLEGNGQPLRNKTDFEYVTRRSESLRVRVLRGPAGRLLAQQQKATQSARRVAEPVPRGTDGPDSDGPDSDGPDSDGTDPNRLESNQADSSRLAGTGTVSKK